MRLLMISPAFRPRIGGVERHVERVSQELAARGHAVRVLTPTPGQDLPRREPLGRIEVVRFAPINLPLTTTVRRAWATRSAFAWADVVHFHNSVTYAEFYEPARWVLPRRPRFMTFHGFGRFPIPVTAPARFQAIAASTGGNICIGDFIAKWYGIRPTFVSYGGVDLESVECGMRNAESTAEQMDAVFVGRLAPDTGIQVYVDALDVLRSKHGLDLSLHVLGDGLLRAELERRAAARGLRVTFHGSVADPSPWLARAKAAFLSGYLAMLEAMAIGKPVFAVYTHDLKRDYLEMSPFARYVAVAGNAETLADAVCRAWPPDPAAAATVAARQFARKQTWAKVADLYLTLYRRKGIEC